MQNTHSAPELISSSEVALDLIQPCIVRAADATVIEFPGERSVMKLPSSKTAGRVTIGNAEVGVHGGPPAHVHVNEEEIFIVKSGAFELLVNGQLVEARAGDVAYMERGESHRFRGLDSGEPNVFEIIVAPGGFENFYPRWSRLFDNGAPDMQAAVQLCGEYGINLFPSDDLAPLVEQVKSKVVRSGKQPLNVLGTQVEILLSSLDTGGKHTLVRIEGPRDAGPPLHVHQNEDELFSIEAGQVEFTLGETTVLAEVGDVIWAPRGFAHTFRLASDDARMTVLMTPGGFDQFFTECALTELAGEADLPTIVALCQKHGMDLLPASH